MSKEHLSIETSDLSAYSTAELDRLFFYANHFEESVSHERDFCHCEDEPAPVGEFLDEMDDEIGRAGDVLRRICARLLAERDRRRQTAQPTGEGGA